MMPRFAALALLIALPSLSACAGLQSVDTPTFEQGLLNATWYGAYHRPLAPVEREPRAEREEQRAAAPQEPRRAQAEPEPRRDPAPVAAMAATPPALPATTPDASYDSELAAAYVRAVYELNETSVGPTDGSIVDIYRHAQNEGRIYHATRPAIGDLVFFHNTWDRNGDGRNNDWYTHVAIVESVADNGTVGVLGYVDDRVARTWLNLEAADSESLDGSTANTRMRRRTDADAEYTQYLAGELFAGFGSLLGNRTQVMVIDDWQPGQPLVAAAR